MILPITVHPAVFANLTSHTSYCTNKLLCCRKEKGRKPIQCSHTTCAYFLFAGFKLLLLVPILSSTSGISGYFKLIDKKVDADTLLNIN